MNIKTFMAAAVAALTLAACQAEQEAETVEATDAVELNDDGSVKAEATEEVPAE